MNIPEYNHFEYGELLATAIKEISHTEKTPRYFRATEVESQQELTDRFSSVRAGVILVAIDGCNADYGDKKSDNMMERPQYFFLVLKSTEGTNSAKIFESQKICKTIARRIIALMSYRDKNYYTSPLQFFDKDSITMRGIGPIGDNWYGVILGFNFEYGIDMRINKDDWNQFITTNQGKFITVNN